jgi:uncharacterized protein (TIGR03437 family)
MISLRLLAGILLAAAVPPAALSENVIFLTVNLAGTGHLTDPGQDVSPYLSTGTGAANPLGPATYTLTGTLDTTGATGFDGTLVISLAGGVSLSATFAAPSFTPAGEGQPTSIAVTADVAGGTGVLGGATGTLNLTISVVEGDQSGQVTITGSGSVTATGLTGGPLAITTDNLPVGVKDSYYSQSLRASGGSPPYLWSIAAGPLPQGLYLSPSGVVSGTPSVFGATIFGIQVRDTQSATTTRTYTVTVGEAAPVETASLTSVSLHGEQVCGDAGACADGYAMTNAQGETGSVTFNSFATAGYGMLRGCQAVSVNGAWDAVLPVSFDTRASFHDEISFERDSSPAGALAGDRSLVDDAPLTGPADVTFTVEADGAVGAGAVEAAAAGAQAAGQAAALDPSHCGDSSMAPIRNMLFGAPVVPWGSLSGPAAAILAKYFGNDKSGTPSSTLIHQIGAGVDLQDPAAAVQFVTKVLQNTLHLPAGADLTLPTSIGGLVVLNMCIGGSPGAAPSSSGPGACAANDSLVQQLMQQKRMYEAAANLIERRHELQFRIIQSIGRTVRVTSVLVTDPSGRPIPGVRVKSSSGRAYPMDPRNVSASAPSVTAEQARNAASRLAGPVAPGEVLVLGGERLGPATLQSAGPGTDGSYATEIGSSRVLFDGFPAPLLYSSAAELGLIVPYDISSGTTTMQVEYGGQRSGAVPLEVAATAPGVFTLDASGQGQAVALNQDYSLNSAANPAAKGSTIRIFATGEGQTDPAGVDGQPGATPSPVPLRQVTVEIGGRPAAVSHAGGTPGLVAGVIQIDATVPQDAPSSSVSLVVRVDGVASQPGVTVAVR